MLTELPEGFKEKFELLLSRTMTRENIPGMSVALVIDTHVAYAQGFGARNLEKNLPATPDTLWGIGSCTKSFTALAIMQLVEQGKIDLYDPISKYIPEINLGKMENPITIHHLLSHSSGIPSLNAVGVVIDRMCGIDEKFINMSSWNDFVLHLNGALEEVVVDPGKKYFYNNCGYTICGEIIERITKMPYEDYIKKKILIPLRMIRSTFQKDVFEKDSNAGTPYLVQRNKGKYTLTPASAPFHKFIYAPGGLFSSVIELTNFLQMNMNGGIFEETKVIESSLLRTMQTRLIDVFDIYSNKHGYGYGWGIVDDFLKEHKLVAHTGSTGVFCAYLGFIPDLKIGIAAAANGGAGPWPLIQGTLAMLLGKDPEKEIPTLAIEKTLNQLTGVYKSYRGILKVSIEKKDGLLFLVSKEMATPTNTPLIPTSDNIKDLKFYISRGSGVILPVEFIITDSGKIDLFLERQHFKKI